MQLGSAELGDLLKTYDGNHVLAFVGYNAGRGRVKQWIAQFGDPRDPKVDVVDWVERIPFTGDAHLRAARDGEPPGLPVAL